MKTLSRKGHIYQSTLLSENQELSFRQKLGKNVGDLFIICYMIKCYCSSLHDIQNIVIFDLNVFGLVIEHMIFSKSNPTLIVTINYYSTQYLLKQISKELP